MGGGTLNMPFLLRKNMFNIAILFFIPVSICLYLIIKRKLYYYIFPLLTILYALILRICGVNNYWAIKIYGLNVFLFIPILTYGFDFIGNKIKLLFKNNIKLAKNLAFLVALAIFVFPYPKITMVGSKIIHSTILRVKQIKITFEPLKPALSKDEYKMRIWSSRNIADRSIYYPAKGYKIAWCEAVAEKPVIITPPNFRKIVARMNNTTEQFKEYMSEAKKGDFFIVNTLEIKIPKSLFKIKHRQGDLVLLEFTGHIPDNENLALKEKVL